MIQDSASPTALLGWMDSLADETRLRLLRLLERQELGVVDLCDIVQMPQSTVSRHLKVLADQGWISSRRQGTGNMYRMLLDELAPPARRLWLLAREQTEGWAAVGQDQLRLQERLARRSDSAAAFFASSAADWDRLRQESYGSAFNDQALATLLPQEWVVADLGCGTGALTERLARLVRQVIGVDQSAAMLEAARARTAGLGNVALRRGDLEATPIDDQACDAALLVLVLTYVGEPARVLGEMRRILRPGGKAAVVDVLRHDREEFRRRMGQQSLGFEPAELAEMLRAAGFAGVRAHPLPPQPGAKGPALVLATGTRER